MISHIVLLFENKICLLWWLKENEIFVNSVKENKKIRALSVVKKGHVASNYVKSILQSSSYEGEAYKSLNNNQWKKVYTKFKAESQQPICDSIIGDGKHFWMV